MNYIFNILKIIFFILLIFWLLWLIGFFLACITDDSRPYVSTGYSRKYLSNTEISNLTKKKKLNVNETINIKKDNLDIKLTLTDKTKDKLTDKINKKTNDKINN